MRRSKLILLARFLVPFRLVVFAAIFAAGPFSPYEAGAQEGLYLSDDEAPKAVFPDADQFELRTLQSDPQLRAKIRAKLGPSQTSIWEKDYKIYIAKKEGKIRGYGVVVEEIGKHRPITFIVGVRPDGKIHDVALMVFRAPQGGEVRSKRFMAQYGGKSITDNLLPPWGIRNIAGATLSVQAISRGVKKALAIIEIFSAGDGGNRR